MGRIEPQGALGQARVTTYISAPSALSPAPRPPLLPLRDAPPYVRTPPSGFDGPPARVPVASTPIGGLEHAPANRLVAAYLVASLAPLAVAADDGSAAPEVTAWDGGEARLALDRPGRYRLATVDCRQAEIAAEVPPPLDLAGPWDVTFPDGRGAPAAARFEQPIFP